jgi:hypothetical protein
MPDRRSDRRISFDHGVPTQIVAIDGTWQRRCVMQDVSELGAKFTVIGSVKGPNLKEFFYCCQRRARRTVVASWPG